MYHVIKFRHTVMLAKSMIDCAVMDTTWFFFDVFSLFFMSSYSEALKYHCRFDG